jgi:hypothetical protein
MESSTSSGRPPSTTKFSEMISSQSTTGFFRAVSNFDAKHYLERIHSSAHPPGHHALSSHPNLGSRRCRFDESLNQPGLFRLEYLVSIGSVALLPA